jgi:hypothetical protein
MKTVVWAAVRRLPMLVTLVCVPSGVASAQSVPSPWTARDIGTPTLAGSATHNNGVFTISGAGKDIWGSADQFMFMYQQVSGDVDIVAKVQDFDGPHGSGKAGVMIRKSLNANSAHAFSYVTVGAGIRSSCRRTDGGTTSSIRASTSLAPAWLRAVRKGSQVMTYWSTDGANWRLMATETIPLGTSAYVGVAVNGRSTSSRATALVSNVDVRVPQALPSGQQSADIGSPAVRGSTSFASGTYTIKSGGYDIWDTSDEFHFLYQPITGSGELIARVRSLTNTDTWAKAGVMVRESLAANARHAMMAVTGGSGYAFQRRPEPGVYSEHTSGGSGTAPGWLRLVRTGDLFEAYRSADGVSWTRIGTDTIAMGDTVYVGLAVTSHNTTTATTAVIDNLKITESEPSLNKAPSVSITAPVSGTQVTLPTAVSVAASASDPENRMSSVDFYAGSTLIVRDASAPYSASWSPAAAGTYALTAVARDADGGTSTSSTVSVAVSAPVTTTAPKAVAFQASADHATNVSKYVLKVFAATANPATATPLATSDLGKPTPASTGEITVDRATFFGALAAGNYLATVTAVGSGGQTQSQSVSFTR